jgi:DNA transformation protein
MSDAEHNLESLPNIGPELARRLREAGVSTPEELKSIGSIEAASRLGLHSASDAACRSALSALEGAIRGIRWHGIPKTDRDHLWAEYQTLTKD